MCSIMALILKHHVSYTCQINEQNQGKQSQLNAEHINMSFTRSPSEGIQALHQKCARLEEGVKLYEAIIARSKEVIASQTELIANEKRLIKGLEDSANISDTHVKSLEDAIQAYRRLLAITNAQYRLAATISIVSIVAHVMRTYWHRSASENDEQESSSNDCPHQPIPLKRMVNVSPLPK